MGELQTTEQPQAIAPAMSVLQLKEQVQLMQQVMKAVMKNEVHYGVIPGTKKPTLLKPGAEKLCLTFRLAPSYFMARIELDNGHREYEVTCTLTHSPTGVNVGQGVGLCTSMESKYRWRKQERQCPECNAEAIIKGKEEYGGGWICWAKRGGCNAKFDEDDQAIIGQVVERVENPDLADCFNTVLKMAKKRAHVDAVLTATAASDIFTQDMEDMSKGQKKQDAPPRDDAPRESTGASDSQLNYIVKLAKDHGKDTDWLKGYFKTAHGVERSSDISTAMASKVIKAMKQDDFLDNLERELAMDANKQELDEIQREVDEANATCIGEPPF